MPDLIHKLYTFLFIILKIKKVKRKERIMKNSIINMKLLN